MCYEGKKPGGALPVVGAPSSVAEQALVLSPPWELLLLAECKLGARNPQISSLQKKQGHQHSKGLSKPLTV